MGRWTGFSATSSRWKKCHGTSRSARKVQAIQAGHNYWKTGAYQIQPQWAGNTILNWLNIWKHLFCGFLWLWLVVGFFWFFFCLSKSPSPFPGCDKHLWHSFTPGPLQHLSPLHLTPEAWPLEPSKHRSIFFSHLIGLFRLFPFQKAYQAAGIIDR